ncbi:hypothetical protein SDC9_169803 [bioreactor metagenome]|uniref:Uncharacterized protein n=1 Tax=bioreactor metagenome TaxID=1076179 RepID=A0A645G8U0_9ZZZZ
MLAPDTAIGNNPTAVSTEYLPPTSSGITKVSYPSVSAKDFSAPFDLSVVAYILSFASSLPYFFSNNSLNILNAIAGSVVVPDFDITLTDISIFSTSSNKSAMYVELILFPTKYIAGVFLLSLLKLL